MVILTSGVLRITAKQMQTDPRKDLKRVDFCLSLMLICLRLFVDVFFLCLAVVGLRVDIVESTFHI